MGTGTEPVAPMIVEVEDDGKKDIEKLDIEIKGSVNILNNKINFYFVKMNNTYQALEEDLKYFKQSFENILFDEGFMNIFDLSKIKKFVLEIS